MKYIGIDVTFGKGDGALTKRLIMTFPEELVHADAAPVLKQLVTKTFPKAVIKVSTAGFITAAGLCSGKSETLNLSSDPSLDTACFRFGDYGGNYI